MSPFSAGTVKISPRASKTARAPVGEMAEARECVGLDFREVRPHLGEVAVDAASFTVLAWWVLRSKSLNGAELLDRRWRRVRRRRT